jgi:hypothetical protein
LVLELVLGFSAAGLVRHPNTNQVLKAKNVEGFSHSAMVLRRLAMESV